jgi:hypothetical protein
MVAIAARASMLNNLFIVFLGFRKDIQKTGHTEMAGSERRFSIKNRSSTQLRS